MFEESDSRVYYSSNLFDVCNNNCNCDLCNFKYGGIYRISINGKYYIGETDDLSFRRKVHSDKLKTVLNLYDLKINTNKDFIDSLKNLKFSDEFEIKYQKMAMYIIKNNISPHYIKFEVLSVFNYQKTKFEKEIIENTFINKYSTDTDGFNSLFFNMNSISESFDDDFRLLKEKWIISDKNKINELLYNTSKLLNLIKDNFWLIYELDIKNCNLDIFWDGVCTQVVNNFELEFNNTEKYKYEKTIKDNKEEFYLNKYVYWMILISSFFYKILLVLVVLSIVVYFIPPIDMSDIFLESSAFVVGAFCFLNMYWYSKIFSKKKNNQNYYEIEFKKYKLNTLLKLFILNLICFSLFLISIIISLFQNDFGFGFWIELLVGIFFGLITFSFLNYYLRWKRWLKEYEYIENYAFDKK